MEFLNWRSTNFGFVSLLTFLLLTCNGVINAESSCNKGCSNPEIGLFKYNPGNVYEYSYESIMTVSLHTTTSTVNDDTSLKISGYAKIFVEENCNYVLQLTAVKVTSVKESTVEKRILQSITKPIRFTFVDGYIKPEICTDNTDDIYSLNIKRGIISMLQASKESETNLEVDIFGYCPTHTSISNNGNMEVITKIRNLNNCSYREQILSGILNGVVDQNSGIKSSMLTQADYSKELRLEKGIIQDISMVEDYYIVGAKKSDSEIKAKVVTTMKLKNIRNTPTPAVGNKRASILFQKPNIHTVKNLSILKSLITDLVQTNVEYIHKDSAKSFAEIVRLMRNSDSESLLELGSVAFPNQALARKVYLDALFRTGTSESAKAIMKQFGKLGEVEKSLGMLSLNLIQVVDKETIGYAAGLLSSSVQKEAFLAIGGLVAKYCQHRNCENLPEVQGITKKYVESLKRCKANTRKEEQRIIYILKGIGNTKGLTKSIGSALMECASPGRPLRIRISALQAYSAITCDNELQQNALKLLRDYNEDAELRIEAYLAAIQCPNAEIGNDIADILNSEKVYQVGGFIASHLRSIRDSTDSNRENLRHYLGNIRINRKFPQDIKRFSCSNELSYRLDGLGIGASADYKLIYSQHGFLPRSSRLNISSEIFGTNFNVMEVNIRQENLENILEYYFGPKGLLNKNFDEILKGSGVGRSRRSIAEDTAKFANKYKTYGSKKTTAIDLDFSLKLFGSEMLFLSLGDNIPSSFDDILRTFSGGLDDLKKEVYNFERDYFMNTMFLDVEMVYPTGIGLPFELCAQGVAISKINLKLSVDIDALLEQNWQQTKYNVKLVPSVDLNINFRVGFNAYVVSTGVRVSSNMHTATGADVTVAFINDNGFTMDIQLPRDKLDLIHVQTSSEFYIAEQDKEAKGILPKGIKILNTESGDMCFDQLRSVGLDICIYSLDGNEKAISSWFPTRKAGIYTKNEINYHIKGYHIPKSSSGTKQWRLDFSTPSSQESHDTSVVLEIGLKPQSFVRLAVDYPQYHLAVETGITNDDKELAAYALYEQNDDIKRNKVGFEKHGNEYRPIVKIQGKSGDIVNEINGYRADGRIVVEQIDDKSERYRFENFQIINQQNQKLILNGFADISTTKLQAELNINLLEQSFLVKSHYEIENGVYELGAFAADLKSPENLIGASIRLELSEAAVGVILEGKINYWELLSKTNFEYVKADGLSTILSSKFASDLSLKNKKNIFAEFACVGYNEGQNKFGIDVSITRGKHTVAFSTKFQKHQYSKNDFLIELKGKFDKHFIDMMAKCDVIGNNFKIENILTSSWGTTFTAKGQLGQRFTLQDILIDIAGTAQLSIKDKVNHWNLKIIGAPERTNSELKISRENQEIIKYNGETMHPQDKIVSAKVNLAIKNILNMKVEHKFAKNGKGELTAHIDTLDTNKYKINLNSKFHIQAPKYDIETALAIDDKKELYFKTENLYEKSKISTKNIVELIGKTLTFDLNVHAKGSDWKTNGEVLGNFLLSIPFGYTWDGSFSNKINTNSKTGIKQGQTSIQVTEQYEDKQRKISWDTKLEKLHMKTKDLIADSKIAFTDNDGSKINMDCYIKHKPLDKEKYYTDFKVHAEKNSKSVCEMNLAVNEYDTKHALANLSFKFGNDIQFDLNGNYKISDQSSPFSYEIHSNLRAPKSSFKSFEISSNGKFSNTASENHNTIHLLEFNLSQKIGNGQYINFHNLYRNSRQQGTLTLELQTENMASPLRIEGSYQQKHDEFNDRNYKYILSYEMSYDNKNLKTFGDVNQNGNIFEFHYMLNSNFETEKTIEIILNNKKTNLDYDSMKAQFKFNDKEYAINANFHHAAHKKGLELDIAIPQNTEHITLAAVFEILGERKGKFIGKIINLAGLDFESNMSAEYQDVDSFHIIASWNSKKLQLFNYNLKLRSQNKSVVLLVTNSEGTLISGNAAYELKKEQNKALIEGRGQLLYKGKPQSANFKFIRQIYDAVNDKEVGFSYTFNGNIGSKNGVSTLKVTNKDFNIKLSICEEKKQCNNVQIQSIVAAADSPDNSFIFEPMQHSLLILVDFRELGYPYEFELQSKTIRQGLKFQYSLDSNIISNNNLKYQFTVNIVPKSSRLQIRIPTREILLEAVTFCPESGIFGKYGHSLQFYFDKLRKPNDVIRLESTLSVTGTENSFDVFNGVGEVRFEHPTTRPLLITGKFGLSRSQQLLDLEVIFDIFKSPDQKVILISQIHSSQLGKGFNITSNQKLLCPALDLEFKLHGKAAYDTDNHEIIFGGDVQTGIPDINANMWFNVKQDHLLIEINSFNHPVLKLNGDYNKQDHNIKLGAQINFLSQRTLNILVEVQPSLAKVDVQCQNLTNAYIELKPGKELHLFAEGRGNVLLDGRIALNAANFLETNVLYNEDNVNKYMELLDSEMKMETQFFANNLERRLQKLQDHVKRLSELSERSLPDFTPLKSNLNQNLRNVIHELEQDPELKQITDLYREIYFKLVKLADDVTHAGIEAYKQLENSLTSIFSKLNVILKETLLPIAKELLTTCTQIMKNVSVGVGKIFKEAISGLLELGKKYGPALKNYYKVIHDTLKPYNEGVRELFVMTATVLGDLQDEIYKWISQLPSLEIVRLDIINKFEKIKIAEKILEFLNLVFEQVHLLPKSQETQEFLDQLHNYMEAKLKNKDINDNEVIDNLLRLLFKAIQSLWSTVELGIPIGKTNIIASGFPSFSSEFLRSFDFASIWTTLITFRLSALNFLLNEDWLSNFTLNILAKPYFLNDFNLHAHIADGHHIFTFDEEYFSFNGNCKYILAQDVTDHNFTLVAQLTNGKLKSLVLTDHDGNFLEVNDIGSIKLNGIPMEYPLHEDGSMHAWRKYYTVWLLSEYGIKIICTSDLKVCHINVSGFYTGKIRGLLGNGNSEPNDDFMLVDGTMATGISNFVNNYGLGKCSPVTLKHKSENVRNEICSDIFGYESPLAYWFMVKNASPYRLACDQAVMDADEKDKEVAACNIALAYGYALSMELKYSSLPQRCLKCPGALGQRDLYTEFSVKIPNNKADVVFVLDMNIKPIIMNSLVAPAITEIRESLKTRGFTDVQISVIAYNESQKYPALLTSDDGKINYRGNVAKVELNGPKNFCDGCLSQFITDKYILDYYAIFENFVKSIVPQSDEVAFEMALDFPFRAGAAKTIVEVRGQNLEYQSSIKWMRAQLADTVSRFNGIIVHLLTPVNNLSLEGVSPEKLIGFNSRLVATLDGKDAKKRQKLQFQTDMGIDLVLNSGGWIFSTQNFEHLKPADQKKALNQVTNSIADTIFKTEIISDCKCLPLHSLHAQHLCAIRSYNFVPNKKVKAT